MKQSKIAKVIEILFKIILIIGIIGIPFIPKLYDLLKIFKSFSSQTLFYKIMFYICYLLCLGIVFTLKAQEPFHTCNPFEGNSSITFFNGYCKILNEENERPIVRFMHMDGVYGKDYIDNNLHNFPESISNNYQAFIDILNNIIKNNNIIEYYKIYIHRYLSLFKL